jgi:hypothetical protein
MSMALNSVPDVYHSSWIEIRPGIAMRYEVEHETGSATLYFGHRDDYVLALGGDSLDRLVELGSAARRELAARPDR